VALDLAIPFEVLDFRKNYTLKVVEYFYRDYARGVTPNPDVVCNREIKFGLFLDKAVQLGFDYIATGHYARIQKFKTAYRLRKGVDQKKDQSYFLYQISQEQLKHCLFPIGEYQKPEVRVLAKKFGLITANKPDSQGICFVGELEIKEFLKTRIKPKIGDIITTDGNKIGEHEGVWYYTIGQRRGIGIGGGMPYYVVEKDLEKNTDWIQNQLKYSPIIKI